MNILAQGIGVLALLLGLAAYQMNSRKKLVMMKAVTDLLWGVQYLLLGAWTGALMDLIGLARDCTLTRLKPKTKAMTAAMLGFILLLLLAGAATWAGPVSLLGMLGKTCTTVAFTQEDPRRLRALVVPSCVSWMIYNALTGSIGGVINEGLGLVSLLVAAVRG